MIACVCCNSESALRGRRNDTRGLPCSCSAGGSFFDTNARQALKHLDANINPERKLSSMFEQVMAPHRTSPKKISLIRSVRSGPGRRCSSTWEIEGGRHHLGGNRTRIGQLEVRTPDMGRTASSRAFGWVLSMRCNRASAALRPGARSCRSMWKNGSPGRS